MRSRGSPWVPRLLERMAKCHCDTAADSGPGRTRTLSATGMTSSTGRSASCACLRSRPRRPGSGHARARRCAARCRAGPHPRWFRPCGSRPQLSRARGRLLSCHLKVQNGLEGFHHLQAFCGFGEVGSAASWNTCGTRLPRGDVCEARRRLSRAPRVVHVARCRRARTRSICASALTPLGGIEVLPDAHVVAQQRGVGCGRAARRRTAAAGPRR